MTHNTVTHKSKTAAVLLCVCMGSIGAHRWYLGHPWLASGWILLTIVCLASGALVVITALLCLESLVLLFRGKAYYRRVKRVELVA